jgi:hypothetical protein
MTLHCCSIPDKNAGEDQHYSIEEDVGTRIEKNNNTAFPLLLYGANFAT